MSFISTQASITFVIKFYYTFHHSFQLYLSSFNSTLTTIPFFVHFYVRQYTFRSFSFTLAIILFIIQFYVRTILYVSIQPAIAQLKLKLCKQEFCTFQTNQLRSKTKANHPLVLTENKRAPAQNVNIYTPRSDSFTLIAYTIYRMVKPAVHQPFSPA